MTLHHPVVDFGEFRIHVIGNPSRLPSNQQNQIKKKLVLVSERAFGSTRKIEPFEVGPRTTHPEVSLLLYVDQVPQGSQRNLPIGKAEAVGYLSTKNLLANTMHINAAAVEPQFQRYGIYEMCKRLAMVLSPIQLRLHGGQPAFYTAQSPYLHIHRGLAQEQEMQPAHLHPNALAMQTHLAAVSNALGKQSEFDPNTSIRKNAFSFNPFEGMTEQQIQNQTIEQASKFKDPKLGGQYLHLFEQMNPTGGDALMAIRRYHPNDSRMWRSFAKLTNPKIHDAILVELLLGSHRREIQTVNVTPSTKENHPPHLSITFKPGKWQAQIFQERLAQHPIINRNKSNNISVNQTGIETNLDAAGLSAISTALECTQRRAKK